MSYTTYLRWATIGALFLALFVPFIVASGSVFPNLFFPYITGKNFAFRIIVEAAFLLYILLACAAPKYRPRGSLILWAVVLFVGWMAIATVTSVDPLKSFWSNFERMEGYIGLLHMFVWFVIAGAVLAADDLWTAFFNTSVGLATVQGCIALFQVLHLFGWSPSSQSGARADTTFGNATYLAVYLLINIFITLWLLVRRKHSVGMQAFYGAALVLQFAGLYYTETRGALLGLVGGLLVAAVYMALFAREKEYKVARRISLSVLGLVVVLGAVFFAVRDTSFVKHSNTLSRLATISLTDRTTQSRFLIWQMAFKGFVEKPVTGWGQENFSYVFNKYYLPQMYNQEQWFDRAHDQFLDWLIAGGAPAFILYVSLYVLAMWAVWRSTLSKPEKAVLIGLFAGYIFNNIFVFDNLVSAMYFFALLAYTYGLSKAPLPSRVWLSKPMGSHGLAIAAPVVLVVIAVGGWALNAPGLARASTLLDGLQTQVAALNSTGQVVGAPRDPRQNLAAFNAALGTTQWPGNPMGYQEVVEQLAQFSTNIAAQTSIDPAVRQEVGVRALDALQALTQQRANDARLELFAATVLNAYGQTGQAIAELQQALKDSPGKQQLLIQLGGTELGAGQVQEALAAFKTAYEEEPSYDVARYYYVAALYYTGNNAQGDALLQQAYGTTVVDDDQLLQIYSGLKLYDRMIAIWQLRVQKSPNDPQIHLGLASAYFAAKRIPETIAELKVIEKISPSTAGQMEQLIKQIQDGTLKPQ